MIPAPWYVVTLRPGIIFRSEDDGRSWHEIAVIEDESGAMFVDHEVPPGVTPRYRILIPPAPETWDSLTTGRLPDGCS